MKDCRIQWDTRVAAFVRTNSDEPHSRDWSCGQRMSLLISGVWLITLLGAAVRLAYLNHPMRYDEAYNYLHFATQSPSYVATHYVPNNHILHTLLVRFATEVFGTAPAALRLPAFAAGVLIIPATAWLAWLLSRRASVALTAALAVCCSSPLIEYSVNARGYSLLALLTMLSAVCVYKAIESPGKSFWWVWSGSLGAAGVYTVPVMVMPLSGLGVAVLVNALRQPIGAPQRREMLGGLALAAIVCVSFAGLLYLPVLVAGGTRSLADSGRMAYDVLGQQIGSPGAMLAEAWRLWMRHVPALAEVILAFGAVAYLVRAVRTPLVERWLPPAIVFTSVALAAAFGAPVPARAWLFALPVFFVCAAQGACELFPREPETVSQRALAGCVIAVLIVIPLFSLAGVSQSPYLCAEPRGLVEVDEVLDECQVFGPERCALVAPYSPAIAYYMAQKHLAPLPLPSSPQADRVYIVADENRELDELWHSGVEGFAAFDPPRVWRTLRQSTVYFADRTARSALR